MSKKSKKQHRRQSHDHAAVEEFKRNEHGFEHEQDTELAAELTQVPVLVHDDEEADDNPAVREHSESGSRWLGWTALVLSIVSLFVFPGLLGPAGAIVGFIAYLQGSRTLGVWAMALGVISLFVALFLSPFY